MSAALMHSSFSLEPAQPLPWTNLWRNSQALALTVALHGVVVALLALGWTVEQHIPAAPSALKTRLVMMSAEPLAVLPSPEPLPVVSPVAEAKPEVVKPTVDPQIQARKLEQAALARKRVEEQKQAREAQQIEQQNLARQHTEQAEAQRQQALTAAAVNAKRAQQAAVAADIRQYQPISKQAPDYPQRALDKGIEGDCTVEYLVNPKGKVESPKVVGNCHPAFIRPSLVAAATFRYQPRVIDGQAVAVPGVRNTFHYKIE